MSFGLTLFAAVDPCVRAVALARQGNGSVKWQQELYTEFDNNLRTPSGFFHMFPGDV